jgi:hypothetical protein
MCRVWDVDVSSTGTTMVSCQPKTVIRYSCMLLFSSRRIVQLSGRRNILLLRLAEERLVLLLRLDEGLLELVGV